jgi:ESCRT-II complex subunit VPS25
MLNNNVLSQNILRIHNIQHTHHIHPASVSRGLARPRNRQNMSSPNAFLSAPTTAASVVTPASTTNGPSSTSSGPPRTTTASGFTFPEIYDWPVFFTLQPNAQTRQAQMRRWANLISDWCRYHRTFRLALTEAADSPLFHNARLRKRVGVQDARTIVDWMAASQEDGGGGRRAEWVPAGSGAGAGAGAGGSGKLGEKTIAWIWWKRPEEWAKLIADWVCLIQHLSRSDGNIDLRKGRRNGTEEYCPDAL